MSALSAHRDATSKQLRPVEPPRKVEPRIDFTIRTATMDDFAWIDAMQKAESDKLGFLMRAAIEKRIEQGNVLVAEGAKGSGAEGPRGGIQDTSSAQHSAPGPLDPSAPTPLGYCIHVDRYMKQDHVGQFIQLNVPPEHRRSLVGAALVKAAFEKSAYGVKLYGLWCRQDLAANRFWEALGFLPLAFRAAGVSNLKKGSSGRAGKGAEGPGGRGAKWGNQDKSCAQHPAPGPLDPLAPSSDPSAPDPGHDPRTIHIYWQRRVRDGDTETPYWFPYETTGGMMAESRLVLPIPLGTHWSDAKPVVLPGTERRAVEARLLEAAHDEKHEQDKAALAAKRKAARDAAKEAKRLAQAPKTVHGVEVSGGVAACVPMGFDLPPEAKAQQEAEEKAAQAAAEKTRIKEEKRAANRAAKQQRRKTDPELLAFSRELRDRWQEHVAAQPGLLEGAGAPRYDVGRLIAPRRHAGEVEIVSEAMPAPKRLDAA